MPHYHKSYQFQIWLGSTHNLPCVQSSWRNYLCNIAQNIVGKGCVERAHAQQIQEPNSISAIRGTHIGHSDELHALALELSRTGRIQTCHKNSSSSRHLL